LPAALMPFHAYSGTFAFLVLVFVPVVIMSTSAGLVMPARTFCAPSSRKVRMPPPSMPRA